MGCKAQFAANNMTIGKNCNAADRPILRMPGTRWVTQRVRYSASQGRTARFKQRSAAGEDVALEKAKNKGSKNDGKCQRGR